MKREQFWDAVCRCDAGKIMAEYDRLTADNDGFAKRCIVFEDLLDEAKAQRDKALAELAGRESLVKSQQDYIQSLKEELQITKEQRDGALNALEAERAQLATAKKVQVALAEESVRYSKMVDLNDHGEEYRVIFPEFGKDYTHEDVASEIAAAEKRVAEGG